MSYIGNQPSQVAFLTDQFSGDASTTAFTMSVAPANSASAIVAITGVVQDPSTYSVNGTTLTFSAAPPKGTGNISVRYLGIPASGVTTTAYRTVTEFTATAGQTTFTPPSYTAGFINVYQNGVRLGSADYTATNGTTVVLATGAALNDLITVESYYVSSVLNAIRATAGAVNSTYIAAGAVGTTQLASSPTITTPSIAQINSTSSGTPTVFADSSGTQVGTLCRAWVNFNGTNAAIRASFNVSSVTRNSTGTYTINFTSALADGNYTYTGNASVDGTAWTWMATDNTTWMTTTSLKVQTAGSSTALRDPAIVTVAVFR